MLQKTAAYRIYLGIFFSMCVNILLAQPSGTDKEPYPGAMKTNYVRVWMASAPETDAAILPNRPLKDVKQTTEYYDGLGRPLQKVIKQGSLSTINGANTPLDLINPVMYDGVSRERYKFLPFVANGADGNTSLNDGLLKLNPFQQQESFAAGQYPGETFYYGQTDIEASPLNRVSETFAPGNSWVGTAGNPNAIDRHSSKIKYCINTGIDEVRRWLVNDVAGGFANYSIPAGTDAIYGTGELKKTIITNEKGHQIIEYRDVDELIVLRKMQLTAAADNGAGSDHAGWLCTYFIYDDFNQLRAVIQPQGVELLRLQAWNISAVSNILDEQFFRYEYDSRHRIITKKAPGGGTEQMVYDKRDRLVMKQDANMARTTQMQWQVTQYDEYNRPTATYLITDPAHYNDPSWHRNQALNTAHPVIAQYANELLIETHYDNYTGIPAGFSTSTLYPSGYAPFLNAAPADFPDPMTLAASVTGLITWTKIGRAHV